jgi:hypothetical protein
LTDQLKRLDEFEAAPKASVRMIGTSSFGAGTIDRRDLQEAGREFLEAFQHLGRPGVAIDLVSQEVDNYFIREPTTRFTEDFAEIDIDNRVEMVCCCFSEVFRHIPEMPTDILGCDYMTKDIVWRSHDGLVFHSRKVRHSYDADRDKHVNAAAYTYYALRDVMYLQVGRIWQLHNQQMESFWSSHQGIESFNPSIYAKSFLEASAKSKASLIQVRIGAIKVYAAASVSARGRLAARLGAVEEAIRAAGNQLDAHSISAVEDFCYLVNHWRQLCEAAAATTLPPNWLEN